VIIRAGKKAAARPPHSKFALSEAKDLKTREPRPVGAVVQAEILRRLRG
jgi:hypothetical protein